ncbi:MAG: hypothetical protein M3308_08495, partial [Actinomycetota bacterium]|nr:hypothetical protein [Actinomycetota bacterium]
MSTPPSAWRATGIFWNTQTAHLGLVDPTGTEHTEPIHLGAELGYRLAGERRCVGVWRGDNQRQLCPFSQPIPPQTTTAQCDA